MASGGKYCFGLPSQMDGYLYPEPAKNVELFGSWYKPRRYFFTEATPMRYRCENVPGVEISEKNFGTIGTIFNEDNLIHLINFNGIKKGLTLMFLQEQWDNIEKIFLEPNTIELEYTKSNDNTILTLNKNDIDLADTILRISKSNF